MTSWVLALAATQLLSVGCAWWRAPDEGSPGHVSQANDACATLFCSGDAASESDGQCAPSCRCGSYSFAEPRYRQAAVDALRRWTLRYPPELLPGDPYDDPSLLPDDRNGFCAALPVDPSPEALTYRLETYATVEAARAAGGQVTHRGPCGACSSFQDLAVYIDQRDLTHAGRRCGLLGTVGTEKQRECLEDLGFTRACTQIWSFNVDHTRAECLGTCSANLPAANNLADGSLNPCLACDEEQSGPVFKAVAGRTRRRSGLSSAIARPCVDNRGVPAVYPVEHFYFVPQ